VKTYRTQTDTAKSRTKAVSIFLMHQLIGTFGIGVFESALATSLLDLLRMTNSQNLVDLWYRVFAFRPYYPIQIALGLYFGWLLSRRLGHRTMIWTWVLPAAILFYAVAAVPTLTPEITSPMIWSGVNQSRFSHYFGWGCRLKDRCFDQALTTQPFYTAVAYSIGGLWARKSKALKQNVSSI
jgi:hypothetical protein